MPQATNYSRMFTKLNGSASCPRSAWPDVLIIHTSHVIHHHHYAATVSYNWEKVSAAVSTSILIVSCRVTLLQVAPYNCTSKSGSSLYRLAGLFSKIKSFPIVMFLDGDMRSPSVIIFHMPSILLMCPCPSSGLFSRVYVYERAILCYINTGVSFLRCGVFVVYFHCKRYYHVTMLFLQGVPCYCSVRSTAMLVFPVLFYMVKHSIFLFQTLSMDTSAQRPIRFKIS